KIFFLKSTLIGQRHGQGISQGKHGGGGGRGGQTHGTCFFRDGAIEGDIRSLRQGGAFGNQLGGIEMVAGDGDQFAADPAYGGQQPQNLLSLAARRKRQYHIAFYQHP